jgi:membrane protease YdiL (CAAX protease family)
VRTRLGLVLVLVLGSAPYASWLDEFAGTTNLIAHEAVWWLLVVAVLACVRGIERRSLASIGLRTPRVVDLAIGVVAGLAIVVALGAIYAVLVGDQPELEQLVATPLWWRAISVVRAAVAEEVLFRGYAIERSFELTRSRVGAVLLPCVVFAAAHVAPWGWRHVIVAGTGGLLFSALYMWRRNLWVAIIAHAIVDGIAVMA